MKILRTCIIGVKYYQRRRTRNHTHNTIAIQILGRRQPIKGYGNILINFEFVFGFLYIIKLKLTFMNDSKLTKVYEDRINTNDTYFEKSFDHHGSL